MESALSKFSRTSSARAAHDVTLRSRNELAAAIVDAMTRAKQESGYVDVYRNSDRGDLRNQFCFFLKPGVTSVHPSPTMTNVLEMLLDSIASNKLRIDNVVVLAGAYLDRHQLMQQHYGVLERLARRPRDMTPAMRKRFRERYGAGTDQVDVVGGFEFLQRYPWLTERALDLLWANISHERLGTGCFAGRVQVGNECVHVINGFTPHQLATYADSANATVVMSLSGDLTWTAAREEFVGRSDPATAMPGSIRNLFYVERHKLGLTNVALSANGSHLSAGPLEALVELRRFLSRPEGQTAADLAQFQFGRKLLSRCSITEIESLLANPRTDGQEKPLFELTEELDEDTVLAFLSASLGKE
jgi:hypothetical protein